ncbi:MAG: hypothetical protein ABSF34_17950, partial [Verrucomicrobiota bacterium]
MKNFIPFLIGGRRLPRLAGGGWISVWFAMLAFAGNVFAADPSGDFSAANQLYAEGKFSAAARAYDAILNSGVTSPALLFNDGNAEFKADNLGKAIAAFRR